MGKRNSNFGKKRRKLKEPTKPILEEKGKVNFEYGGDRTEQSKIAFKKRENERLAAENDCFIDPEQDGSDDDLEIKELPHRDFAKSLQWGKTAQKMMEKMGWKRGMGLGPENNGVVNPVIPDGRYDGRKRGLGTVAPQELKEKKIKKENSNLQLPSYLRKMKNNAGAGLSNRLADELIKKYKMKHIDLRIGMELDANYGYLNKTQTQSIQLQIETLQKLNTTQMIKTDDIIKVGVRIHTIAREEELGANLELYRQEAARLWRFVSSNSKLTTRQIYDAFLEAVEQQLLGDPWRMKTAHSNQPYRPPQSSQPTMPRTKRKPKAESKTEPKTETVTATVVPTVILSDSDDDCKVILGNVKVIIPTKSRISNKPKQPTSVIAID